MRFIGDFYVKPDQKARTRIQTAERILVRGTRRKPQAPRDVFIQSGPRGILVNWRFPSGYRGDIVGWRVYKDDENSLFCELHDTNTVQHFIETTAGSAPPVVNVFVSSFNSLGIESPKVQAQGSAIAEAGAPIMPHTPPTYTKTYGSGGGTGRYNTY